MGKASQSIEEDQRLSEEVRRHTCLYDRSDKDYKVKDRVENAWRAVEQALGYEEGNQPNPDI